MFHLPWDTKADVQTFRYLGLISDATAAIQNQVWNKPRGVSMVHFFLISGGAGGGGGQTGLSGNARGGGGGGASGGVFRALFMAQVLPDILHVQVGQAGYGGAAGTAGADGQRTNISITGAPAQARIDPDRIMDSGAGTPSGGSAGIAGGGAGGNAIAAGALRGPWAALALFSAGIAGIGGGAGGSGNTPGAAGASITAWTINPVAGAAGGGGVFNAAKDGGSVTATAILDLGSMGYWDTTTGLVAAAGTGTSVAINGSAGVSLLGPFFSSGGAGGGSQDGGVGGDGGHGGIGAGGGGGGGGTTGGRGGAGGPGICIITSW